MKTSKNTGLEIMKQHLSMTNRLNHAQWRTEGGAGGRPPRAPEGGGRQNGHQSTGARERFFQ
jgi:hypothetical protein